MNESRKTITFVAVAVLVVLIAWIGRPGLRTLTAPELVGKELFPEFKDPRQAASLEIVEFNESTAKSRQFKVAEVEGKWSIPSHHHYPADAKKQLGEAAASMVGLKALDMASDSPGDHKLYGVVDPDPQKLKVGDTGVGTRVTMQDKDKNWLMSIIIGEQVPDSDKLRYVRVGDKSGFKDPVYTVAVKTDKLSTKFEDWIEEDLLDLSSFDVRRVRIRDYSADLRAQLTRAGIRVGVDQIQRNLISLEYDDKDYQWNLLEDKVFDQQEQDFVDIKMAEDEELNTSKLNDMKSALDRLKIVDVARKPEGLSETLKTTGEVDPKAMDSLAARGFYLVPAENGSELISSEGEITVLTKDGVQYVLRFGQIAGRAEESAGTEEDQQKEEGEDEAQAAEEKESEEGGVNRYLFVMAEFNPEIIPKPELEALPTEEKASEGEGGNGEGAEGKSAPSETAKGEAPKSQSPQTKTEGSKAAEAKPDAKEAAKSEAAKAEAPEKASEKDVSEDKAAEEKAPKGDKTEADEKEEKSELEKQRERIEKKNKREQEDYDEKITKGKERVKELNARFADWYYVISDDVYKEIHLSREDVIKKKEAKEDENKGEAEKEGEEGEKEEAAAAEDKEAEEAKPPEHKETPELPKDAGQQKPDQDKAAEDQGAPSDAAKPEAAKQPPEQQGEVKAKVEEPKPKSADTPKP